MKRNVATSIPRSGNGRAPRSRSTASTTSLRFARCAQRCDPRPARRAQRPPDEEAGVSRRALYEQLDRPATERHEALLPARRLRQSAVFAGRLADAPARPGARSAICCCRSSYSVRLRSTSVAARRTSRSPARRHCGYGRLLDRDSRVRLTHWTMSAGCWLRPLKPDGWSNCATVGYNCCRRGPNVIRSPGEDPSACSNVRPLPAQFRPAVPAGLSSSWPPLAWRAACSQQRRLRCGKDNSRMPSRMFSSITSR